MPYYTEDTAQRSVVSLADIPSSFSDVMAAQQASTYLENPEVLASRAAELFSAEQTGERIDQRTALGRIKDAGLEGHLEIDASGTTPAALDILIERKRDELFRATTIARGSGGFIEGASRFGVALGTSLASPTNVGLSFIPIFGQARYARLLALARTPLARAGVRAGVGAAEGAAGAALIEPVIYSAKQYEQADYSMLDSLLNVAFGGVLGGGLHAVGGASADLVSSLGDRMRPSPVRRALDVATEERMRPVTPETIDAGGERLTTQLDDALTVSAARVDGEAARVAEGASHETREAALRVAEGQAMSGERVDVEALFAGERGRLPDGTDTLTLTPGRFDAEAQRPRAAEIAESAERRAAAIEAEAAARAAPGEKPRYTARLVRELTEAREQLAAAKALASGAALTPAQIEQVRRAVTADAIERGTPVPEAAMEGQPESLLARAQEVRRNAVEEAARSKEGAPDPEEAAQVERAAAVDEEIAKADETLEAAEEEAKLARQLLDEQSARFGDEAADETITAAEDLAERMETWARAAELAQVCVLRGG